MMLRPAELILVLQLSNQVKSEFVLISEIRG